MRFALLFALSLLFVTHHPQAGVMATVKVGDREMTVHCIFDTQQQLSFFYGPDDEIGFGPTCKDAFEDWNKTETKPNGMWWI